MRRIFLLAFLIVGLVVGPVFGDGLLATVMGQILTEYGFVKAADEPISPYHVARFYAGRQCLAGYIVNVLGEVEGTMVTIMPGHDVQAYYGLGTAYLIIQTKMGKLPHMSSMSKEVLRLKGYRLLDAITSNLKHLPETTFRFDDMFVNATKHKETRSIIIILRPALR